QTVGWVERSETHQSYIKITREIFRVGMGFAALNPSYKQARTANRSICAAELGARAQEALRIHRFAVDPSLVVQMWSGGAAGGAALADDLTDLDRVAALGVDAGEVAVARRHAVAVVDLDHLAVAALPAGKCHCAVRGRAHRVAGIAAHVEAGMHRGRFQ